MALSSAFIDVAGLERLNLDHQGRTRRATAPYLNMVQDRVGRFDSLTRVDRDPCPKCGVRKDFGCNHQGAV
ncbi:hypothetical protein SAMN06272759_1564 [Novosphingobium sp. B1]|nr:hypothetical protein SAMN06272759_1564 [Novosphingobium sp. B1]